MTKTMRRAIKRLLGQRLISFCRDYYSLLRLLFQEFFCLTAMIRYKRRYINNPEVLLAGLRTSAHILDKGLQIDNWEASHGQAQYERLCRYIEGLKGSSLIMDPSFRWGLDKKSEYEQAQKATPDSRSSFVAARSEITEDELLQLVRCRRSVRIFEERLIDPSLLIRLADVVSWSPTSCNRQSAKLFITQNPEKVHKCLDQCGGATCIGETIPCFIAICADTRFYMINDRNLPFIDVSLGVQNMLLMAHLHGIEGTILGWVHPMLSKKEAVLRKTLGIPKYYAIVLNLMLGYPKYSAPVPERKSKNLAYTLVE